MQILFHIGAHGTGPERLVKSLLRDRDLLSREGIAVPGPGRYRRLISGAVLKLRGAPASPEGEEVLLEAIFDSEDIDRAILSNEHFISMPSRAVGEGHIYPRMYKSAWLRAAFPTQETGFALTLRNPATFIPALLDRLSDEGMTVDELLDGWDPRDLSWADTVRMLRDSNPGCPVLVWCNEDSPLLWGEILREMAGLDPGTALKGADDGILAILTAEGRALYQAALAETPPDTDIARRRLAEDILEHHADAGRVDQEIRVRGWTPELVAELTEIYDEEIEEIAGLDGVRLLTP